MVKKYCLEALHEKKKLSLAWDQWFRAWDAPCICTISVLGPLTIIPFLVLGLNFWARFFYVFLNQHIWDMCGKIQISLNFITVWNWLKVDLEKVSSLSSSPFPSVKPIHDFQVHHKGHSSMEVSTQLPLFNTSRFISEFQIFYENLTPFVFDRKRIWMLNNLFIKPDLNNITVLYIHNTCKKANSYCFSAHLKLKLRTQVVHEF